MWTHKELSFKELYRYGDIVYNIGIILGILTWLGGTIGVMPYCGFLWPFLSLAFILVGFAVMFVFIIITIAILRLFIKNAWHIL